MRSSLFLLSTALALPTLGRLTLYKREIPSVVSLDIQRKDVADPVARDRWRRKRDTSVVSQQLDNEVCASADLILLRTKSKSASH